MSDRALYGMAALLVAGRPGGWPAAVAGPGRGGAPVEDGFRGEPADGGPGIVTLSEAAEKRLGIRPPRSPTRPGGTLTSLTAPWSTRPTARRGCSSRRHRGSYQRARVQVAGITGDRVVAHLRARGRHRRRDRQGAAELVGVETGIDGEE